MKKLTIVSVASEVAPFSKTGGLADVARSLPKSLKRLGHDVVVVTPLYKKIIDPEEHKLEQIFPETQLTIGGRNDMQVSYYRGELMQGLPVYFVSFDRYFGKKKMLYGSEHENRRFLIFDAAVLKLIVLLGIQPDIIHCHDWHAGLIPELIRRDYKEYEPLQNAATVFTIHNLAFQLGHNWWEIPGAKRDSGISPLPDLYDDRHIERINFTKRAILNADVLNAVSETYADEILQRNFGQDLHRILQNRKDKLFGVVNGIDYHEYNPANDPGLKANYTCSTVQRKLINRVALQKFLELEPDEDACVIVMTSRIAEQKGFDILLPIIPSLMTLRTQLVIMGDGEREYLKTLGKLTREYPKRIAVISFDQNRDRETLVYAGGSISLFPSRFEPCGTGQLKSFRYGCVPVAREIGGLSDTVIDFNPSDDSGNGFVFKEYDAYYLLLAIVRAYAHYQHPHTWKKLMMQGMKQATSWELPAREYLQLYKKAIKFKHG